MADILVVDDEIGIRELLSEILGDEGHTVLLADSAQQARSVRVAQPVDLVLLDIWMPDTDGVTLLREWASNGLLSMPVIMMSGHATIDTAVEATRIGAIDFLEKPITLQKLLRAVQAGLAHGRTRRPPAPPVPSALERTPAPDAGRVAAGAVPRSDALAPSAYYAPDGFSNGVPDRGALQAAAIEGALTLPEAHVERYAQQVSESSVVDSMIDGLGGGGGHDPQRTVLLKMQALPIEAPLRDARDAFERAYFEYHLMREQGSMTRVAERTGLERTHLYRKLKQLGIDLSRGAWRKSSL